MKPLLILLVAGFALGLFFATRVTEQPAAVELAAQTTCPPCRQNLDGYGRSVYVTHQGSRVYVCCPGCAEKMKVNWAGYVGILAELGEGPERVVTPEITNLDGRPVCDACRAGACELPEHLPKGGS